MEEDDLWVSQDIMHEREIAESITRHSYHDVIVTVFNEEWESASGVNNSFSYFKPDDPQQARLSSAALLGTECQTVYDYEEGVRNTEKGWFSLDLWEEAHIEVNTSHIPEDLVYGPDWRFAVYVMPSTCVENTCTDDGFRIDDDQETLYKENEVNPCRRPKTMPQWFLDETVNKHTLLNFTINALEDVLFKFEVHITNGLYLSAEFFFLNISTIYKTYPKHANDTLGQYGREERLISPQIAKDQYFIPTKYSFLVWYQRTTGINEIYYPLNLPERFKDTEKGRVNIDFNVSSAHFEEFLMNGDAEVLGVIDTDIDVSDTYWALSIDQDIGESRHYYVRKYRESHIQWFNEANDELQEEEVTFALQYFPYFSNCYTYGSRIPIYSLMESDACSLPDPDPECEETDPYICYPRENWDRRDFEALVHIDDVVPVNPYTSMFGYPTADWCLLHLRCNYEEDLAQKAVNPRWFEADEEAELFYIWYEPLSEDYYMQGGTYMDVLNSEDPDHMLAVSISEREVDGDFSCNTLCFPRTVTFRIEYYQITQRLKRLINAGISLADFDRDATQTYYDLYFEMEPLGWLQLVINFAFDMEVFFLLYCLIGSITVTATFVHWGLQRLLTTLKNPPKFRYAAYLKLTVPPIVGGTLLGLIPVCLVLLFLFILIKGDEMFVVTSESVADAAGQVRRNLEETSASSCAGYTFDCVGESYSDIKKVEVTRLTSVRTGRIASGFFCISIYLVLLGSRLFIPTRVSKREQDIQLQRNGDIVKKYEIWTPTIWKRSNFLFWTFIMVIFCVIGVEFSLSPLFGGALLILIAVFQVVSMAFDIIFGRGLKEALLMGPIMSTFGLWVGIVTLGADDFLDFVLCYFIETAIALAVRVFFDPYMGMLQDFVIEKSVDLSIWMRRKLKIRQKTDAELTKEYTEKITDAKQNREVDVGGGSDTVEPILSSYTGYCGDAIGYLLNPFIIVLFIWFREEMFLPEEYGIKLNEMQYYLVFALVILFFSFAADVFTHNALELMQGWKLYDYLVYANYRFLQREKRWKGLESTVDECIDEGLQSVDQMCFSSQYFFMNTVHTIGCLFMFLSIVSLLHVPDGYNIFDDPATLILWPVLVLFMHLLKLFSLWFGKCIGIWKLRHADTGWHSTNKDKEDDVCIFSSLN